MKDFTTSSNYFSRTVNNELLVPEGDRVTAKQLIFTLQRLDQKQAELAKAKPNVAGGRS